MSKVTMQHEGKEVDIEYDITDIADARRGKSISAKVADSELRDLVGEELSGVVWQRDNVFESAGLKDANANALKKEIFDKILKAENIDFPLL